MKRTNDLSQLSKEEYEALNDRDNDSPLQYGIPKASNEELAGRRVVTARKRPSTSDAPVGQPAFNAFTNIGKSPFASVSLVAPTSSFPVQQPEQAANPFRGMNHLTLPQTSITAAASASSNTFTVPMPAKEAPKATPAENSEYSKQMKKLNESFFHWAERQVKDNAIALWKDGVKDYLKHQQAIAEKYPPNAASNNTGSSASTSSFSAPPSSIFTVSTASSTGAFAWPPAPATAPTAPAATTSSNGLFGSTTAAVPPPAPSSSASTTAAFKSFTMPSTSTGGFSMGAASTAPSSGAASVPLFPAFNFPTSASNPPTGSSSGSGLFFPTTIGASTATTSSLPLVPSSSAGDDADGGEGGDEGEPILAPEKVLRNENDKDTILFEATAKLYNFSTELKEWRDTGKGTFRLTEDPTTQKKRMVVRNGTGKITLNAAFYKGFKVERSKAGLQFSVFVAKEEGSSATEYKKFLLKLNDVNAERVQALMEKIASEMN